MGPPVRARDQAPREPTLGPLQRTAYVCPRSGDPAPSGPPLGPLMCSVEPPVLAGDQAPREPTMGPLRHSAVVRLRPGDPAPSGPPLGALRCPVEPNVGPGKGRNPRQNRGGQYQDNAWTSRAPGPHAHGNAARQVVDGLRMEVCGQQKQSNDSATTSATPITQLLGAADTQTAHPATTSTAPAHQPLDSANAETTPAGAPAAPPTESSDPTQHAKGRTSDCPGPRKDTTTRRNVTQGVSEPVQGVHLRGSEVMSEFCKVGYSATLARSHVHNFRN